LAGEILNIEKKEKKRIQIYFNIRNYKLIDLWTQDIFERVHLQ